MFAHEREASGIEHAQQLSRTRFVWWITYLADLSEWDFLWEPVPWQAHQRHAWRSQHQTDAGVYLVPATGYTETHYHNDRSITRLSAVDSWKIPAGIDMNGFDFSWHPDYREPAYEYHFGTQWQSAGGPVYPGNQGIKMVHAQQARATRQYAHWKCPDHVNVDRVDYSWHPNPLDPPYIYHFPDQWQPASGVTYTVPGATEIKLVDAFQVKSLPNKDRWLIPDSVLKSSVDYSWHPNPLDPPYIYHFPSQWQNASGVTYTVLGATKVKLTNAFKVRAEGNNTAWSNTDNIVYFDYSWHPDVLDPAYIYEFGTQWYDEGGPVYEVNGAADRKYVAEPKAQLRGTTENWHVLHPIDRKSFNWTWQPHPKDPPFIYVWGNNYWSAEKMPTIEYHVPGATERKYMEGTVKLAACLDNWEISDLVSQDSVNYAWVPDPQDPPYIYEFATQWQHNGGARYIVPGATETKYIEQGHRRTPDSTHWTVPFPVESFDYSWHPDNTEEPYIYEFATQWQPNGGPVYTVPGAVKTKYIDISAKRLDCNDNWQVLESITDFDYSWHPGNIEEPYIYVFGNQHYPSTIMPTIKYTVPGAVQEKFINLPVAKLSESTTNWQVLEPIDETQWDWTWVPNPKDPPYVYQFGNQWNTAEYKASIRYVVPGATEVKYMELRTCRLPDPDAFEQRWPNMQFDWSWEPNPFDPPYTYVFGNQWNPAVIEPTVIYLCDGGTEYKYIDELVATLAPYPAAFEILDAIESFDYSWRPNPKDPPYLYVFGNQWLTPEQRPAVQYRVGTATEIKYMDHPKARRVANSALFVTHHACEFDYSWEPDPGSPPYIYVFGNQHWPAEVMPTIEYHVAGATEIKYMDQPQATLNEHNRWTEIATVPFEFDRSWVPDPGDPAYVYVFGNQWHPAEEMSTIEYRMPGATERKFVDSARAQLLPAMDRWDIPEEINADNVDFSWHPHPKDEPYIHHFGSEYQLSIGLTYTVPGAGELKFAGDPPLKAAEKKAVAVIDIFYLDRSNAMSSSRFTQLQQRYPHIQKVRFVNSIMDTIRRCLAKTKNQRFWVIGSENVYDEFDFAWHAQPWQSYMTHVFGSQWNKWSDTFLVNKWEFERNAKWATGIEQFPNLNFVRDQQVVAPADASPVYVLDHGNADFTYLESRCRVVRSARYFDNYLDSLRRLLAGVEEEHIWVTSSLCDYTRFDFSWQPEAWQRDMLHVFPSNEQKFGDTFYVPVRALQDKIDSIQLLDWFETVNYCEDQRVPRYAMPVISHAHDSHIDVIKSHDFTAPLTLFTIGPIPKDIPTVSLWRDQSKTIVPIGSGAGVVIVPQAAIPYINTQMYDYPYIDKSQLNQHILQPLDIVFISNGESNAEYNLKQLKLSTHQSGSTLVHHISGINGRVAAYHAAANASTTPWFFAVFAKLEVNKDFDWSWQPDRMQQAKHYIFHAGNPVNGLVYGHQAMIAYNKKLALENTGVGLDFTLDQAHEVVPILSGTANYAESPWMAWRTAFREALKLRASLPDVENEYRLKVWLTKDSGTIANGHWSHKGAQDAVEFYKAVNGDLTELRKSYEWAWLATYAFMKRNLTPDQ